MTATQFRSTRFLILAATALSACVDQSPARVPASAPPAIGVPLVPAAGTVRSAAGAGVAGVSISFSGIASPALTLSDGTYGLQLSRGYSGTASPTRTGCTFVPATRAYGNVTTAQASQDFVATCAVAQTQYTLTLQSSASAPQITVSPTDLNGSSSGSTPFVRTFRAGTVVTLTAPSIAAGAPFERWEKNEVPAGVSPSATVMMDADYRMKAVYASVNTISGTVRSTTGVPISGVTLTFSGIASPTASTADGIYVLAVIAGYSGTVTPSRTGCTFAPESRSYANVSGTMAAQDYVANCPTRTLTVQSNQPATAIVASPLDLAGSGGGSTPFARSYGQGTVVTLTAPATVLGAAFDRWERNGLPAGSMLATTVTVDADMTMKAVYASPQTIAGTVRTAAGAPLSGVTIDFSGIASPATTNANGAYFMSVRYGYVGTSKPARIGCTFAPDTRLHANVVVSTLEDDFVATCVTRTLVVTSSFSSPLITVAPADLAGLGGGPTAFTRAYGDGSVVTLTAPSVLVGAAFFAWEKNGVEMGASTSATVTMDANHAMRAVYANPQTITGTITTGAGGPVGGVTLTFTGIGATSMTASNGIYSMAVPYRYSGTVTPSKAGCTFNPTARTLTNVTTVTAGQSFTAVVCP